MDKLKFKKRVLFIGVPDMALVCLNALCYAGVNIIGAIGPEKSHNTYHIFKRFVQAKNIEMLEYDSLKDSDFINKVKGMNPDIAVVCSFNTKIPKEFIECIPDGIVNVHPSLLPAYRGGNPYSRVIENGDAVTGVTLHFMTEDFDKGDIIAQEKCEITPYETMGTIFEKTNEIACNMLLKTLFYYEQNGTLPRSPQPEGKFTPANNYKDTELIIDYNKSAVEIERFVRALNPYINAVTVFRNQLVRLHKVTVAECDEAENYEIGQICKIEDNKLYIKTGKGCIIPEVMQFSGLFTGDCKDFVTILKPVLGERFTNE